MSQLVPRSRQRLRVSFFAASLVAGLAYAPTAHAQSMDALPAGSAFDLHLFRPAVDTKGIFTVNGTDILGAGSLSLGFVGDVGVGLANVGSGGQALVSSMISGTFQANVGIANLLVIGAQIPFQVVSGPDNQPMASMSTGNPAGCATGRLGINTCQYNPGSGGLNYQGLGDIVLHAKLRWLRSEYYPVGLAVLLQAGFPVMTNGRNFAGEPGPWLWPSVAVERHFGRHFRLAANAGFRFSLTGDNAVITTANGMPMTLQYGPSVTFGLGASYRVGSVLDLGAEFYGAQYVNGFGNALATTPMEAIVGAKIFIERNSFLMLGAGPGFGGGLASADIRAFLGITFEPSIGDTDGDGYRDDVDHCPQEPEDFDNFEDDDGCPDPDNDRDGVLDVDDQCPLVPGDHTAGPNGRDDGCPHNQVSDRDGDQIPDNVDQCPDDPEDRDGYQDEDGCPDPDNDNDGILDTDDLCPNDPEDRDGFQDEDGCPDPDNDNDRIPDVRDRCPNEPETYNGLDDEDGCPDNGVITVVGTEVQFRDQIHFAVDSAQIVDDETNRTILEALSQLLHNRTDIEQVEIEGHTDERAPDDHNLQLSRDRANSVVQALVSRGIVASRLVAAGYGEYCPVNPQHNEAAWAANRRVQVFITRLAVIGRTSQSVGCPRGRQYIPASVGAPSHDNATVAPTTASTGVPSAPTATPTPTHPATH